MDWNGLKSSIFVVVGFEGIFLEDHADVDVHESFFTFSFFGWEDIVKSVSLAIYNTHIYIVEYFVM